MKVNRLSSQGISAISGLSTLSLGVLGAGQLTLPYSIKSAGLGLGEGTLSFLSETILASSIFIWANFLCRPWNLAVFGSLGCRCFENSCKHCEVCVLSIV